MKTFTKVYFSALALCCGISLANAQVPPVEAPTPPYAAENVMSFISDKYTPAKELINDLPKWGQTATWAFVYVGETGSAMQISNLGEKGWLPILLNDQKGSISGFDYVHFDIYCNENTSFRIGFHTSYEYDGSKDEYYGPFVEYTTPGRWASYYYPVLQLYNAGMDPVHNIGWLRIGYDLTNADCPAGISYSNEIYLNNFFVFKGDPNQGSGIKNTIEDSLLKAYPSIVKDYLTLESAENIAKVSVYTVTGQQTASFTVNSTTDNLNLSDLSAGSYIVSAQLSSGKTIAKRIIKL